MKTTMASATVFVLALSLVTAAAAGKAEVTTKFCSMACDMKKWMDPVACTESCDLSESTNVVVNSRIQCKARCAEQKDITAPAMKACEEKCDEDYVIKAGYVAKACARACAKEKNERHRDYCKKSCTPPS